jgi:hypothetical protein
MAYAISRHVKVRYWRAPVILRKKDVSRVGRADRHSVEGGCLGLGVGQC